jgi:hypothetical protein
MSEIQGGFKMKLYKQVIFSAMLAAIALAFIGCENDPTDANIVNFPAIQAPSVTATTIQDGVKLEWSPVVDAQGYYNIYRREAGGADVQVSSNSNIGVNPVNGKYFFRDLRKDATYSIKAGTKYTYTVVALSSYPQSSKTAVEVTTGTFLEKGAELDPPEAVTLELLPELNEIKVTVTPADTHGDLVESYTVELYRNGTYINSSSVTIRYPQTIGTYRWTSQSEGEYTARTRTAVTSDLSQNSFYTASKEIASEPQSFESSSLFGTNFSFGSSGYDGVPGAAASTLANYVAALTLQGLKKDVTYSFERAPVDKLGSITSDYVAVILSKDLGTDTAIVDADFNSLRPDLLGNPGSNSLYLYDRKLPAKAGSYRYRVKAEKGTGASAVTQYEEGGSVTVDPAEYAARIITLAVTKDTVVNNVQPYTVTPSITYNNLLPTGAKLVIYWVKSDSSNSYQDGRYDNKIEFTKAELEATTVTAKTINVPTTGDVAYTTYYVYAQAWLEFTDGTKKNISYSWSGVDRVGSYGSYPNYTYYAKFNY